MIEFLKNTFNLIKEDIIKDFLKIDGEIYQIIFTWGFIIMMILLLSLLIQQMISTHKLIRHNKKTKKKIERSWFTSVSGKDKNKELGNIR